MDSDFWTSRLAAAKRQFNLQHHHHGGSTHLTSQFDRLSIDDLLVEEETRPDYSCPYCFEEFDITSLCYHLEDEHSYESKVTRRRRLRRVGVPSTQALSLLGKDLREAHLQVLLGGSGSRSINTSTANAITDPFLSSLVLNFPTSEADEISKSLASNVEETTTKSIKSQPVWKSSFDPSLSYEERQQKIRQAAGRAVFVQDLFFSTVLEE